jgi:hypothetical protein
MFRAKELFFELDDCSLIKASIARLNPNIASPSVLEEGEMEQIGRLI